MEEIIIVSLTIFVARAVDVCLGTFRTVCIVKNKKFTATIIAFVEVLIWFLIAREAITTELTSIFIPLSFAGGFATGTYIGLLLSNRFIAGQYTIHAVSAKITDQHIQEIKEAGFGISFLPMEDNKKFLILQIDKKQLTEIKAIIESIDDEAFLMVNETKYVQNGYMKQ